MIKIPFPTLLLLSLTLPACDCGGSSGTSDAGTDAAANRTTCYIETQFRCVDYPAPTGDQAADLATMCSSTSGLYSASCPTNQFGGKCTHPASEGFIERFYTGADLAYAKDFCETTASGVWSTTF